MKLWWQANIFFRSVFVGMLILLYGIMGSGCNNETKQADAKQKAKAATTQTVKPLLQTSNSIPAMYLERTDFLEASNTKYKDKLILQLSLQKDSNRFVLSVGPAGKSGGVFDKTRLRYPKPFVNELDTTGANQIFEEHHTKENDYQALWNEVKKYSLVKFVIFEPEVDSNNHFRYKITGVEKLPFDLMAHGFATKTYYSHPSNHVWK